MKIIKLANLALMVALLPHCTLRLGAGASTGAGRMESLPQSDGTDEQSAHQNTYTASAGAHAQLEYGIYKFPLRLTGHLSGHYMYPFEQNDEFRRVSLAGGTGAATLYFKGKDQRVFLRAGGGSNQLTGMHDQETWEKIVSPVRFASVGWETRNVYTNQKSWFETNPRKQASGTSYELVYMQRTIQYFDRGLSQTRTYPTMEFRLTWYGESSYIPLPGGSAKLDVEE